MARRKSRTLTEVELEFMQEVWNAEEVSAEDVMEALSAKGRDLSDGTVRKMLGILVEKGYLTRRRSGRAFLYKAKVDKDKATTCMVVDLLKRAFGGNAALMVSTLMDSRAVRRKDVAKIRRLIRDREQEGSK